MENDTITIHVTIDLNIESGEVVNANSRVVKSSPYSPEFRREVLNYMSIHGVNNAAHHFDVARTTIRKWREDALRISNVLEESAADETGRDEQEAAEKDGGE